MNILEIKKSLFTPYMDIKKCSVGFVAVFLFYFCIGDIYLYFMIQNADGVIPLILNNGTIPCHPQPYCHLDMKALLLDLPDFYVQQPLCSFIYEWTNFGKTFSFISANAISVSHVFLALVAAKCVSNEALTVRRIAVLLFVVRNVFDAMDGTVARAARQSNPTHTPSSTGYWVDGLADGLGTIFFFVGCLMYILRHPKRGKFFTYSPLPTSAVSKSNTDHREITNGKVLHNGTCLRNGAQPFLMGAQAVISSICWNRAIALYTRLLEKSDTPTSTKEFQAYQRKVVKSTTMWIIILCWRIFNVHCMIDMLLVAIFLDKMVEFMTFMQFMGFIPVLVSSFLTELHINYIETYLASYNL